MRFMLGVALAVGLAGPALAGIDIVVPPAVQVTPIDPAAKAASLSLTRMAASLPAGKPWAEVSDTRCRDGEVLTWTRKSNKFNDPDLQRIFQQELSKAGFKVSDEQDDLFADKEGADLQVGALITDLRTKMCGPTTVRRRKTVFVGKQKGAELMDVEWQVYSADQGKILARIHTSGGLQLDYVDDLPDRLMQGAFSENVRQLAMSPDFRTLVTSTAVAAAAQADPAQPSLRIAYQTASRPIRLEEAAKGVVLVRISGGFGSGVLISPDGYLLTNHHVTRTAQRVHIRWADGSETIGEVVRTDAARDVSLIKAAKVSGAPLALRHRPVELGEAVYAIGTPLDGELQNTVTRGVVSARRSIGGMGFIQSDAQVTHGDSGGPLLDANGAVVGLTDFGVDPAKGGGLNFFIPIDDALKTLGVEPMAQPAPLAPAKPRRGAHAGRSRTAAAP